jgi:hypothetical protein
MQGVEESMKLESANSILSADPTEAEIRAAFTDDEARGEHIILSESDQVYIQLRERGTARTRSNTERVAPTDISGARVT